MLSLSVLDGLFASGLAVYRPIDRPLPSTNEFRGPGFMVYENSEEIIREPGERVGVEAVGVDG